ncbi:MAG: cyclic nucleotide-binding domain-containing protein, partial [Pseudomonadota bacterium]|nr:cyclic nucleotide-binding domain-containing protein [Pseudomonadota bacterium]
MSVLPLKKPSPHFTLEPFLTHYHRRHYSARSVIIHAGEPSDTLYYITHESVSIMIEDDDGNDMLLALFEPRSVLQRDGLFESGLRTALV